MSKPDLYTELHDAWEGEGNTARVSFGDWLWSMAENERGTLQQAAKAYLDSCVRCPQCFGEDDDCQYCEGATVVPEGSFHEWHEQNKD